MADSVLITQLRGLCPAVMLPKCKPGEGVCIPCRAADRLEWLQAEQSELCHRIMSISSTASREYLLAKNIIAILKAAWRANNA